MVMSCTHSTWVNFTSFFVAIVSSILYPCLLLFSCLVICIPSSFNDNLLVVNNLEPLSESVIIVLVFFYNFVIEIYKHT